jgi:DNA modification methylase
MMLILGDCLEQLKNIASNSVHAIVTDPPYGISFMGKRWDYDVPSVEVWRECLRVLKPGGHALIACGTRTQHRMVVNIEEAGFEIRDVVTWLYGSGFPKSHNVKEGDFKGWGTALKPACEFWTLARKPLEGTVVQNIEKYGVGALNIDGCRVSTGGEVVWKVPPSGKQASSLMVYDKPGTGSDSMFKNKGDREGTPLGRWPANLILDEEAAAMLDEQSGGVSRFFYAAKASKSERNAGCEHLQQKQKTFQGDGQKPTRLANQSERERGERSPEISPAANHHPTVKPIKLMAYLCRLITPPAGTVLDPFMGSGSTGVAAIKEGFEFIGIEREPEYLRIAKARIDAATEGL